MTHLPIPVLAQGSRAELMAKLTEHDEALNTIESTDIVFRTYSLTASSGKVKTTWSEVLAALEATTDQGMRTLWFDFVNSPNRDPLNYSQLSWEMPGGTLGDTPGVYDFKNVKFDNIPSSVATPGSAYGGFYAGNGMSMSFADDVHIINLAHIHGNSFLLYNTSSTNIPISITPNNNTLYLDGTLLVGNNSITWDGSPANPTAKPVFKGVGFENFDVAAHIHSDSAQVLLGLFGTGESNGEGDSIAPLNPVFDFGGGVWFVRANWQTNAFTSSNPAFIIVERVFGNEGAGQMNEQTWTFLQNPENMTFELTPGTRVTYWVDYASDRFGDPNARYAPLSASFYADPSRSGNYYPRAPAVATQYNAQHNQLCLCDPTPDGSTALVIQLPSGTFSSGEVAIVKDAIGTAAAVVTPGVSAPITIKVEDGVSGTGDSFALQLTPNGVITLNDAAAAFTPQMVGKYMVITGATTPANNGSFPIVEYVSPTSIKFVNKNGVAEAFTGSWLATQLILGEVAGGSTSTTISTPFGKKTLASNGIGGWTVI
jgi:hypothetical protein